MKSKDFPVIFSLISMITFLFFCFKSGIYIMNYTFSIFNSEFSKIRFGTIDLVEIYNFSFWQYSLLSYYNIITLVIEAFIAYITWKFLYKLDMSKPFSKALYETVKKISNGIFFIWFIAVINNTHVGYLEKSQNISLDSLSTDTIFLYVIFFIFTQIIKRGIEIQTENDLTI